MTNAFFDPALIERQTFEDFNLLTPEQLANKIIHHSAKVKGVEFLVWSKYDDKGELLQRVMLRASLMET